MGSEPQQNEDIEHNGMLICVCPIRRLELGLSLGNGMDGVLVLGHLLGR